MINLLQRENLIHVSTSEYKCLTFILGRLLTPLALPMIRDITSLSMFIALILKLPRFKFCSDQNLSFLNYKANLYYLNQSHFE